jgi:hypothetical protein
MRKIMTKIVALILGALIVAPVYAGMDTVKYTLSGIGKLASSTNSATYVVRGMVESIYCDMTALGTGTVTVASDQGTIFSKSVTADGQYFPRAVGQTTAGATLTWGASGTNGADGVGVTYTPTGTEKIAVAGDVTVTLVSAVEATVTNNAVITLIINK